MTKAIDISGQRFGKLTAIERLGRSKHGQVLWRASCDCGGETTATAGELRGGHRKSCACGMSHPVHGMRRTRLYRVWTAMKTRCSSPKHPRFARYGGRGITVCSDWQKFAPFASWALANGYSDDLQIDRRDNGGNYEPGNCRFVTAAVNMANRG